jgi:hypothetical protein
VRVLKFFVAKLSMFVEERSSVESASFLGDLPLGKVYQMKSSRLNVMRGKVNLMKFLTQSLTGTAG